MSKETIEIKDYLHLYLGCKINTSLNGTTLTGYWYDRIMRGECDGLPILRPLSDMTEEEKQQIGFESYQALRGKQSEIRNLPAKEISCTWAAKQTAYLLKQGFDLFNLIEKNLAIDKTKIK
jgi:hypothetical protein